MNLHVRILDQNDEAPKFSQIRYTVRLKENGGKNIALIQFHAADEDEGINAKIRFDLQIIFITKALTF